MGAIQASRDFFEAYREKKNLEEQLRAINARINGDDERKGLAAELVDAFIEDGVKQLKMDDGSLVFLQTTFRASKKTEVDPDTFVETMREAGYGAIIKETINANTLSSVLREDIETGRNNNPTIPISEILSADVMSVVNVYEIPEPRVRLAK